MNNLIRPVNLSDLQYHIIPPMPDKNENISIYNKIFDFWSKQWERNFSQGASPKTGWKDHFLRQSYISSILHKGEVMCCQLHTKYNIHSLATLNSEYFKYVTSDVTEGMKKQGISTTMTIEYLCSDKKWKRNSLGVSFGKTILALGAYLANNKKIDSVCGMPIYGNKVDIMMDNIGAKVLLDPIEKYGYKLKFMVSPTSAKQYGKDKEVLKLTETLWESRLDHTLNKERKVAAA